MEVCFGKYFRKENLGHRLNKEKKKTELGKKTTNKKI